jgi:hypothetical protein
MRRDTLGVEGMIRRRLFTFFSFVSMFACFLCLGSVLSIATGGGRDGVHWDRQAQKWLPVPRAQVMREAWQSAALAPFFAIAPAAWLRRFLREQRVRNRLWRGQCGSCGYDLHGTTGRCPECGEPAPSAAPPPHAGRVGPGTQAMLRLVVLLPVITGLAFCVLWIVLLLLSDVDV